jgi:mannosylglycoprotein endo-beta-mannosidase
MAAAGAPAAGKQVLDTGWLAARSTEVALTGVELTTTHPPATASAPWMHAAVPGTYVFPLADFSSAIVSSTSSSG